MIISQIRDAIGVTFGKKHTRSGGHALDFYASQIIELAHIERVTKEIDKIKRPIGVLVKARCTKSKVRTPYLECDFHDGQPSVDDKVTGLALGRQ